MIDLDAIFDPITEAIPDHAPDCSYDGDPDCCETHLTWLRLVDANTKAYNAVRAEIERLRKVEAAMRPLCEKIDLLDRCDELNGVFVFAHTHGIVYRGPTWEHELAAYRAAKGGG